MPKPHRTTFDNQLIELESVDSTNNYAMGQIHAGLASDGMVCLARNQWAGKGQRGKTWLSEPGQNLMMSLVIEPGGLKLTQQFLFSSAVALGILDLVKLLEKDGWSAKWPNDIYWNDRKAAGILIESVIQGQQWPFAVVGVGMNLNQENFPQEVANAISLQQIIGHHTVPVNFARELVPSIQKRIGDLRQNPHSILTDFNASLYKKNQVVTFKKGEELLVTTILGVAETGQLVTGSGDFAVGEVVLVDG